jgi:hypothetical protein
MGISSAMSSTNVSPPADTLARPPREFGVALLPGRAVPMGPYVWAVPPLNVRLWKAYKPLLAMMAEGKITGESAFEHFEQMSELAFELLRRNYTQLTLEAFDDLASITALPDIIVAAMEVPASLQGKATAASPTGTG